jgi:nucleoside phosphorylase
MTKRLSNAEVYTIGWITVLPIERAAATALLDERHDEPETFCRHDSDHNTYTWGRIAKHNLVIASLEAGLYGTLSAASTVARLVASMPHIRTGLLVGVAGGIPRYPKGPDIRLGDIVVSQPDGTSGGVIQYDLRKVKPGERSELKGYLASPPPALLSGLAALKTEHEMVPSIVPEFLQAMQNKFPLMAKPTGYVHQGVEHDRLFNPTYRHEKGDTCQDCDPLQEINREPRESSKPVVHYGVIASGDTLVKDGEERDAISRAIGELCICFEMEAAGLMNHFPCLVIKGICNYADSHKNDQWQRYAAATAAAYAKELLHHVPSRDLNATQDVQALMRSIHSVVDSTVADFKRLQGDHQPDNSTAVTNIGFLA